MKSKRILISIISALFIITAAGFLFKTCSSSQKTGSFQTEPLKKGTLENTVTSTGTLSAVQTVEVGSQVSGIVERVLVDYNDTVKKGQVLAILDKTLFEVAIRDAKAGVSRAKAKLDQANTEMKRNQTLFQKGHIAELEFLSIKTAAETAKSELESAEAVLNRAQTNLDYSVIRSPIDGTVIERTIEAGRTIAASFQAPKLFIIAEDLTRMQIEANVDESDIGMIKKNQTVRFEVQAYPDQKFTGTVRQIRMQPTTINNVVNYTVVVDASNENNQLLPGMTATLEFCVEKKTNVLVVTNTAFNFKLPATLLQQYSPQIHKKLQSMSMPQGIKIQPTQSNETNSSFLIGNLPENIGQVYYVDEDGIPSVALLEKGVTDGKVTEITNYWGIKEGQGIIIAYQKSQISTETKHSSLLPPPPGH